MTLSRVDRAAPLSGLLADVSSIPWALFANAVSLAAAVSWFFLAATEPEASR